jgi:hypothetical protein
MKKCSNCKEYKPLGQFHAHNKRKDGKQSNCKECKKEYRVDNIDKIKEQEKEYKKANKEYHKEYYKEYRANNIDKIKEYQKHRRKTVPLYKHMTNTRCAVYRAIKNEGYSVNTTAYRVLGCCYEEYRSHIEQQFITGMTWDNYGEWQYDHIIPLSFSESEEEIILLFHHSNVQPLWSIDNDAKYVTLTEEALNHPIYKQIMTMRDSNIVKHT